MLQRRLLLADHLRGLRLSPAILKRRIEDSRRRVERDGDRLPTVFHSLVQGARGGLDRHASRVSPVALARRLDAHGQTLRILEHRTDAIVDVNIERREARLHRAGLRLRLEPIEEKLRARRRRLDQAERLLKSVSYQSILDRGFALVTNESGTLVRRAADVTRNAPLTLEFSDGKIGVLSTDREPPRAKAKPTGKTGNGNQGSLF